jgi:Abnormal spindle-like microcephaly-assoc'd, ASPM-SPD-2-Hydin
LAYVLACRPCTAGIYSPSRYLSRLDDMGLRSIIQTLSARTVHFITIGTAVLLLGMVPVDASAATSQLACTPTNLGFGAVVVGHTRTLLVTLTNNGQSSVTVSGIAVGKSEFTTSNLSLPLVLLAGQSVDLSVSFTPTAMGRTGATIKLSSSASNTALRLNVAGTGVSGEPVTASPSMVSFGQVAIGTISTVPVVLTNGRSWKVTLSALQTTGGGFSMSRPSFPLTLGAGQSVTVNVAFAPQSAGTTGGKLFVSGSGLAIPLTGTGTAPGQLTANLGNLNFANVPVGNSETQSVTLTNSRGSSLTVSNATLTGTGFTLSGLALPLTLGAGQSATFSVAFAPQSAGSASGNLAFTSNASNSAMNLPLSGNTALVAITVNPNNTTLAVGSPQQFTANVTGTSKTAVAWTVSGAGCIGVACGRISINGLYVPPSSVPSPAKVTVKATSVADPTKSASANVAILGAVAVLLSITPTSASVPTAGKQLITASVTGTSNTAVTWGLSGAGCSGFSCGTLSTRSLSAVYSAPSVAPTPASVNVIATSVVDPTKSASANLIVVPAVVVGVTPANVSVTAGATQQFAASVTGTSNTAVAWTVSGTGCSGTACGTISSSGIYTAPAAVPSPATVTTTATSVADPTKSASANVTIMPIVGTSYYLATAADGGSDSNNGLSSHAPWLTPNHAVNCGDVIIAAASTAYDFHNFAHNWGTVTCAGGNNVAWLTCATFDACKISVSSTHFYDNGMLIQTSYWGVQGWEITTSATSGQCFDAYPYYGGASIHHIIFANDIANVCGEGGFSAFANSPYGVDYFVVVGSIAYNSAGGSQNCVSGINAWAPAALDTKPGTHYYFAGNLSYDNVDGNPCAGGSPTDGEGLFFDSFDGSQSSMSAYTQQAVIDNNIAIFNGGRGIMAYHNVIGGSAPMYFRHNTVYGNNTQTGQSNMGDCGEMDINTSYTTEIAYNLVQQTSNTGCAGNTSYAFHVKSGDGTDHVYSNYGYSAAGHNTDSASSGTSSFGPNNTFSDPSLTNPVDPGAPSCGSASSVPNCLATVIANFTPTNATAIGYGYQIPSSTQVYDPLFPQWLCNVNLPAGLVTMGCLT